MTVAINFTSVVDNDSPQLVLMFPASGISALSWIPFGRQLKTHASVYGVDFTWLASGQHAQESIASPAAMRAEMASIGKQLADKIFTLAGARKITLIGHCSGGIYAYEAINHLAPSQLKSLILIDTLAARTQPDNQQNLPHESEQYTAAVSYMHSDLFSNVASVPDMYREQIYYGAIKHMSIANSYIATPISIEINLLRSRSYAAELFKPWARLCTDRYYDYPLNIDGKEILSSNNLGRLARPIVNKLQQST